MKLRAWRYQSTLGWRQMRIRCGVESRVSKSDASERVMNEFEVLHINNLGDLGPHFIRTFSTQNVNRPFDKRNCFEPARL